MLLENEIGRYDRRTKKGVEKLQLGLSLGGTQHVRFLLPQVREGEGKRVVGDFGVEPRRRWNIDVLGVVGGCGGGGSCSSGGRGKIPEKRQRCKTCL